MGSPPPFITLRNALLHGFTHVVVFAVTHLPCSSAYALGKALALLAWWSMPRWRKTARRNMELLWHGSKDAPSNNPAWCKATGRDAAISLGWEVVEFIRMGKLPVEQSLAMVVETVGVEELRARLAQEKLIGRGVIVVSLHLGNWELCGAYLASRVGHLRPVGKKQRDEFFTRLAFPWRARYGMENIFAGEQMNSAILRTLKDGSMLGLVSDQNGGRRGVFAPFGAGASPILASSQPGAAALSLRTGSPVVMVYALRLAPGKFRVYTTPWVDLSGIEGHDPSSGKFTEAALAEGIRRINAVTAKIIAEHPGQWLWGHKRWKTRPEGSPYLY